MNMTYKTLSIALISILGMSACTNLPTRMHGSGVKIAPVSNETGAVRSAAFWTDSDGISLRGEVALPAVDESLMTGHVDIAITVPDGSKTVCTIAPLIAEIPIDQQRVVTSNRTHIVKKKKLFPIGS